MGENDGIVVAQQKQMQFKLNFACFWIWVF